VLCDDPGVAAADGLNSKALVVASEPVPLLECRPVSGRDALDVQDQAAVHDDDPVVVAADGLEQEALVVAPGEFPLVELRASRGQAGGNGGRMPFTRYALTILAAAVVLALIAYLLGQ
jgi:hypothetical protein